MKIQDCINYFGCVEELAEALNIKKGTIFCWNENVPYKTQEYLEKITSGALVVTKKDK